MASPKISVIVTVYNKQDYIAQTLDSILCQSLYDIEVIIINDGSTDQSLAICQSYSLKDSRLRLIHQENQGVILARNNAIQAASADLIFPLDSDDLITPDCLEKLYLRMQEADTPDVVYAKTLLFGQVNEIFNLPLVKVPDILFRNCVVCSALFKKSDWSKYQGYKENMRHGYEDWDFWLSFVEDQKVFVRLEETLFKYRILPNSRNRISKQQRQAMHQTLYTNHREIYDHYRPHPLLLKTYWLWRIFKFIPALRQLEKTTGFFVRGK